MTETTPYRRRSNLREALLERAVVVLRERGEGALSLRELARDVGVSHAAPVRHFATRQQLLEAVAIHGFEEFAARLRGAVATTDDPNAQAQLVARAYIDFATSEAHLVEVMFRQKTEPRTQAIERSAAAAFAPMLEVFQRGERDGVVPAGDATSATTLFFATLQGIAALVNCGVIAPAAVPELVDNAVPRFIGSRGADGPVASAAGAREPRPVQPRPVQPQWAERCSTCPEKI